MERTKQPQNQKRRRQWVGRIHRGADKKRGGVKETRQDKATFWRRSQGSSYLPGLKGKTAKKRHEKARAKAKRSKAARKRNR